MKWKNFQSLDWSCNATYKWPPLSSVYDHPHTTLHTREHVAGNGPDLRKYWKRTVTFQAENRLYTVCTACCCHKAAQQACSSLLPRTNFHLVIKTPRLLQQQKSYCLLPDTLWLRASKNAFKVGSVKFANSLSPPTIVKKVCTGSKSSQGT